MAGKHAERFAAIEGADVVAAVDTRPEVLAAFCTKHEITNCFGSLEQAIQWGEFDAAVNVTPDGVHFSTTMDLLRTGKHVLCEKPLATNHSDAVEMARLAAEAQVVNMVNLSYREVPAMQAAARLVAGGQIGDIRYFEASYLQSWLTQAAWGDWRSEPGWLWRLSSKHGSKGVLGDVGIHILDFATFVAGEDVSEVSCTLKTFHKTAAPGQDEYVLDANDSSIMTVSLSGGAVGTVGATRYASGHLNDLFLRLHGTKGGLEVAFANGEGRLRVCTEPDLSSGTWRHLPAPDVGTNQEEFVRAITSGTRAEPDFARGAALQAVLDAAEASDADGGRRLAI